MSKLFSLTFVLFLLGCGSEDVEMTDFGTDYYPILVDSAKIYQVEETTYNLLGAETNIYQLRETIVDSTISVSGEISFILKREKRMVANDSWSVDSLWSVRKNDRLVVVTENNIPLVKLTFPIAERASWNGNAYNNKGTVLYTFDNIDPSTLKAQSSGNAMIKVVIADEPQNLVRRDQRYEVYERGVGLLEKNYITLLYCTKDCDEAEQILSGRILYQYLISND